MIGGACAPAPLAMVSAALLLLLARPPTLGAPARAIPDAVTPLDRRLPLVPFPKESKLTDGTLEIGGGWTFPAGVFFHFEEFAATLANRFDLGRPTAPAKPDPIRPVPIDGGIHDMKLPPEGYRLEIRPDGVTVFGQDEEGLRHALRRLGMLAFSRGGKLYLPLGVLSDWPSTAWRGAAMSVGPDALGFQSALAERVLAPLLYNHVVLECGRAAWRCLPNVRGPEIMPLDRLAALFAAYRKLGVDPIPLIQSFGHMEWLFQGGENLDLALDPKKPYALDPRKPGTGALLGRLWAEAVDLLHPDALHFGCDEVDLRDFPGDAALMTELWKLQMPVLGAIAKAHSLPMLLWGDMALSPGEAIDATNAPNAAEAEARREAIPPGARVCDWHYRGADDYAVYLPSIQLWHADGHDPIAASWYDPADVRGMAIAAVQRGAGTLQTIWAGEASDERQALEHPEQFAALVLSAEYAWSGQQTPVADLPYRADDLFRTLFFEPPMPLSPIPGVSLAGAPGPELAIGRYRFAAMSPAATSGPRTWSLAGRGGTLALALGLGAKAPDHAPVATVTVRLKGGGALTRTLRYGEDLRAAGDPGPVPLADGEAGRYACLVELPKGSAVVSFELAPAPGSTPTLLGASLF